MRICIPVDEDQGLDSVVCAHFGSAPLFMIVEQESGACRAIVNTNQHHGHGMCQPLAALAGESLDGIVVGGIGARALMRLEEAGVRVFQARHANVRETVAAAAAGTLPVMTTQMACAGHGHGHGR
jgi:predicted Fe-Mo cluster-binding NifX family protein